MPTIQTCTICGSIIADEPTKHQKKKAAKRLCVDCLNKAKGEKKHA